MSEVSIYFFAGDFGDVLRRFAEGRGQIYQTHDEVARLVRDFVQRGVRLNLHSLVTGARKVEEPLPGVRVVSLGSSSWRSQGLLREAVEADRAERIVAHFPNPELLDAVVAKKRVRSMVVLANSYNRKGVRSQLDRWKIVRQLNLTRFEWVSNHCIPATRHLAAIGVRPGKLVPWDIPHPHEPSSSSPKSLRAEPPWRVMYAGAVVADKGVTDLIEAVAILRRSGLDLRLSLAGLGDLDGMRALARERGVADALELLGLVANDEVVRRMREADVVAVPSRRMYTEGFPLTMFEAIASRTPIVCSDHPMFRLNMIDGQAASVFPSGDPAALARVLERVLRDPALYRRLSEHATATWQSLKGPADWRTMLVKWGTEDDATDWMRPRVLRV
jgi:hypothetical protein